VLGQIDRVKSDDGIAGRSNDEEEEEEVSFFTPERTKYLKRMSSWAAFWAVFTVIGHVLLWPVPMFGARISFSKSVS
jgi:hypothetical protein